MKFEYFHDKLSGKCYIHFYQGHKDKLIVQNKNNITAGAKIRGRMVVCFYV